MDLFNGKNLNKDIFRKIEKKEDNFPNQPKENDEGNKEYKWKLINKNIKDRYVKINKLASQMLYRLYEGDGKAVYLIGVRDNGISIGINTEELFETLNIVDEVSKIANCKIKNVRIYEKNGRYISTIRITNLI